jgi:hypothetical protein
MNSIIRQYHLMGIQRDSTVVTHVALGLAKFRAFAVTRLLMDGMKIVSLASTETGITMTQSLTSVSPEQVDSRALVKVLTAFVTADGFIKWLKANRSMTGPWTERPLHLAAQQDSVRETITHVFFWVNFVQMRFRCLVLQSGREHEQERPGRHFEEKSMVTKGPW